MKKKKTTGVKHYNVWIASPESAGWMDADGRMTDNRKTASRYKSARRATDAGERWMGGGHPRSYEVLTDSDNPTIVVQKEDARRAQTHTPGRLTNN